MKFFFQNHVLLRFPWLLGEGVKKYRPFRGGECAMNHALNIKVSKERMNRGIMACRQLTLRERLLRFLLGSPVRLTIVVPGDSVDEVAISRKGR